VSFFHAACRKEEITDEVLATMSTEELRGIGLSFGKSKMVKQAIDALFLAAGDAGAATVTTMSPSMLALQSKVAQATSQAHLVSDASLSLDSSHENCRILKQILLELGLLDKLPIFLDNLDTDDQLASWSSSSFPKLKKVYKIPDHMAASFVEKCRIACKPVDAGHDRWLKACLILRACARGVRPFVAAVMKKLHERVVNEVKETIREYKSECDNSDWTCESLQGQDLAFDERPSVMQVASLEHDGTATTDLPHRLGNERTEPFLFSKRNTKCIFSKEADDFGLSNLYMRSLPADASASRVESERQLVMLTVCKWNTPYLEPFEVHREDGTASFTVVYCQCKIGEAPLLVVNAAGKAASSAEHASTLADSAHLAHGLQDSKVVSASETSDDDRHWRFWTIEKKSAVKYTPHEHKLISGDIVTFSGKSPEGIISGNKYTVLILSNKKLGKQSFDVCTTLVPSNPFNHSSELLADAEPRIRILRPAFPIGLYRDAVYRYHTKGTKSELSQRWDGVDVRHMSTDFCEFAKCFCSPTKKNLKNYFAPDAERSPELLYNMIMFCKAFNTSTTGFCSFFCDGDQMRNCRLEPILDGIQDQAPILTACRNAICHGDLYSLEEVAFDQLKACSEKILHHIEDVAVIMNHAEHAQTFERIREVVVSQRQEIFHDDLTHHPPRVCILNRRIELTSEERQHFNEMIQSYQHEICSLNRRVLSMENRRFDRLPVCMMQDISDQISEQVGKHGREGVVYNVEIWGELLAAKVFRGVDPHWRRELNSLTSLLHRNIVQVKYVIYDGLVGKQREEPPVGYVMERMDCSLFDYSKQTKLSLRHILSLLEQVALALAYTHANNVAHMDIKPENILLDESKNVATLCDFGCAYFLQTTLRSTLTARGTPFFMAPEMKLKDVKSCEPFPVDVYSFGVTLFYLINPDATCQQLSECDWSSLPDIPLVVSQLGRSCTESKPEDRPKMKQIHSILQQIAKEMQ